MYSGGSRWRKALIASVSLALLSKVQGQMNVPGMGQQGMMQQQQGEACRGGRCPKAEPNRVAKVASAVVAGGAALARSARDHPRTALAAAVAASTAVYVGRETRYSGLLVSRNPRMSVFRPSNAYLIHVLDGTEDAPVASPLRGVILSVPDVPSADEEEVEDAAGGSSVERHRSGGKGRSKTKKMRRRTVGGGASSARSSSARDRYREGEAVPVGLEAVLLRARLSGIPGAYEEESTVRDAKGRVKTILAGVRIGRGLALYHKFAQGLENLDAFDGQKDCELLATESSSEGLGSILGLVSRSTFGTWCLQPLRLVLLRETSSPVIGAPHSLERRAKGSKSRSRRGDKKRSRGEGSRQMREKDDEDTGSGDGEGSELRHRQYTMALSAVQGAGCSGTWVFRVTHDVETDEVWFQSSLAQRAGALGVTLGGDQASSRVRSINDDMLSRGERYAAVLKVRDDQSSRLSSLSKRRERDMKELERDRILHPEKYRRVHRYMRDDSHTVGGTSARPARWGEERRRNDIRLK